MGFFVVRVNSAIRTLYLPPRKLLPVLRKKGHVPSVGMRSGVRLNNRFWINCANAGNAAAPSFQRPPHCRLRPYIPSLVSLIAQVTEEHGQDQLGTPGVFALRIGGVDTQKHVCGTLRAA